MPDTVKLPGVGPVKKEYAIGAGAVLVLAVGVYYYRKNKAAQSSAASAATTAANTTTAGDTGTTIDPQTGYPYGSPEDQAALASMSFGQLPTFTGDFGGSGGSGGTGTTGPGGFVDNSQWAQAAEQLMGSTGSDAIAAALGKYLTGQPVTSDQQTMIQQAIAVEGYPPVPGPSGFPPSMDLQSGGGTPVGGFQAYAPGGKSLAQLASLYPGETAADLEKINPGVFRQYGSKPLPKGTGYYVPKETNPATT